jgi:hypothetical protein
MKPTHVYLSKAVLFLLWLLYLYHISGTIIGTIPEECVEDAILMLKARNEERKQKEKEEENQKAKMEREKILELLENLIALQKK